MRNLGQIGFFAASLLLSSVISEAKAGLILGNLTGANDLGLSQNIGQGTSYAMGFTTGSSAVLLTEADLRLTLGAPASNAPLLSLFSNTGGLPGTSLATFTNPTFTNGTAQDAFTINFTLAANTTYWLVLSSSSGAGALFQWTTTQTTNPASNNGVTPTGPLATSFGSASGTSGTYRSSTVSTNYQLLGTAAVPEPSSVILAGLGGLCAMGIGYRRRARLAPAA